MLPCPFSQSTLDFFPVTLRFYETPDLTIVRHPFGFSKFLRLCLIVVYNAVEGIVK